ncbi:MAG: hypothetical protein KAG53_11565 [Endozoicomonadaceae bacterium]|nr:hypothetical protein [Endozoicomonadaceae bacterium]
MMLASHHQGSGYPMRSLLQAVLAILFFPMLVSSESSANSDVYKVIKKDGTVVYTNDPDSGANARAVRLSPHKVVSPSSILRQPKTTSPKENNYSSLTIISPEEEASLHNPVEIIVTTRVIPDLATGHTIQLLQNGVKTKANTSGTFTLKEVHRGEHRLKAQIVDGYHNVLYSSAPRTIYVHRHSIRFTPKPIQ